MSGKVNVGTIISSLKRSGTLAYDDKGDAWWLPWPAECDPYADDVDQWAQPVAVKSDLFKRIISHALNGTHIPAKVAKEIQEAATDEAYRGKGPVLYRAEWCMYDHGSRTLRIAISHSHIIVISPEGHSTERNGVGYVLTLPRRFDPLPYAEVISWMHPDAAKLNALRSCLTDDLPAPMLANFLSPHGNEAWNADEQAAIIRAWWLGLFIEPAVQGRPILGLIGQKGSGKTVTARLLGRLFYGRDFDVSGGVGGSRVVKDLVATIVHNPVSVADDQNDVPREVVDTLCRIATGSELTLSTMHETLGMSHFHARGAIAITSNRPAWALRDDLMDRMLPVCLSSPEQSLMTEMDRSYRVLQWRAAVWGETLYALYYAITSDIGWARCTRFESWENCVRHVAEAGNWHDVLHSALRKAKAQSVAVSCWADQFVSAIFRVAIDAQRDSRYFTAAELYDAITMRMGGKISANDADRPSTQALRNPMSLGKFLARIGEQGSTVVDVIRGPDVNGCATWAVQPKIALNQGEEAHDG